MIYKAIFLYMHIQGDLTLFTLPMKWAIFLFTLFNNTFTQLQPWDITNKLYYVGKHTRTHTHARAYIIFLPHSSLRSLKNKWEAIAGWSIMLRVCHS